MKRKVAAGLVLLCLALAGALFTLHVGARMRARGEQWWSQYGEAAPEKQREMMAEGRATPPSKVRNTTDPMFIGCFITAMLGLISLASARQDQRKRKAQQSPPAYPEGRADAPSGSAEA